jgi:hypothetical protein
MQGRELTKQVSLLKSIGRGQFNEAVEGRARVGVVGLERHRAIQALVREFAVLPAQ